MSHIGLRTLRGIVKAVPMKTIAVSEPNLPWFYRQYHTRILKLGFVKMKHFLRKVCCEGYQTVHKVASGIYDVISDLYMAL